MGNSPLIMKHCGICFRELCGAKQTNYGRERTCLIQFMLS